MDDSRELMRIARERTGLSDFGDDSFREGLEHLVRSLRTEAKLNAVGEVALPELILKHLSQRLQIESWYARHPGIDEVSIASPLIGLGLPRTGSTALSILLAEDPDARSLRRWEASEPCPPPSTVRGLDPRITRAEAEQALADELAPRLGALVPTSPTGPEECQDLMALDFRSHYFQAFAYIPSYSDWLLDADLVTTYRYEKRALKLLQWGEPVRPWRLKCPSHLLWLEYLDGAFPDARFVMTHRDPAEVMVSVSDVYLEVGRQFSEEPDPRYLGDLNVRHWTAAMNRVVAFRRVHGDDRFFDIDFREFQQNPISQVHALYSWLGEPVSPRFEEGMRVWWAHHAADREPNVHPDPRQFDLDVEELRTTFGPYTEKFREWTARDPGGHDVLST
jgi:hypothetical protein